MPRRTTLVLVALSTMSGGLQAKTMIYDQDPWEVVYDPDAGPLRAACLITTYQPRGILELTMFDDQLDLSFYLRANYAMAWESDSPYRVQVDEFPVMDLTGERFTMSIHTYDVHVILIDQIARGKELRIDVNADDRWDVKFPLDQAFPALKALATCYKDL